MADARKPGIRRGALWLGLAVLTAATMVACGQRGPLYLPDRDARVVTRPGSGSAPASAPSSAASSAPSPAPAAEPR